MAGIVCLMEGVDIGHTVCGREWGGVTSVFYESVTCPDCRQVIERDRIHFFFIDSVVMGSLSANPGVTPIALCGSKYGQGLNTVNKPNCEVCMVRKRHL